MTFPAQTAGSRSTSSLPNTLVRLRELERLNLPDAVVPLRELSWTPEGFVVIPSMGEARPNDWARQQISALLGIRFERWFEAATPEDCAEEMNRRLRRAKGCVRLRLSRDDTLPTLRAVVSPSYAAVKDSEVIAVLDDTLQGTDAHLHRLNVTERVTSVLVGVGQPQHLGGKVGLVWGCINIANSNVGWAGLSVTLSLYRLICKNGMRAPTVNAQLLKVRHRSLNIGEIRAKLDQGLRTLPENLVLSNQVLEASSQWPVINIKAEARELLRERGMIRNHLSGVLSAYRLEAHKSVFGLAQAMTRHAQQATPEDRIALEELAGSYVLRSSP